MYCNAYDDVEEFTKKKNKIWIFWEQNIFSSNKKTFIYTKGYNIVKNIFPAEVFNTCLLWTIHSNLKDRAIGNAIIKEN